MLTRISNVVESEIPAICAYKKFLAETIVERDIGAQETCHMLLKLPLVILDVALFQLMLVEKYSKEFLPTRITTNSQ